MAGPIALSSRFTDQCAVVVSNNYDTTGSLTRAQVGYLTPAQVAALFTPSGLFAEMDSFFRTAIEMKACGIKTNGMYDWIMSGADRGRSSIDLNRVNVKGSPSLLNPFILAKQDSVINNDFWAITCGAPNSGYTYHASTVACATGVTMTGPLTAAQLALGAADDRVIRVVNRYGVELDARWFLSKDRVYIFSKAAGGGFEDGQWKVLAATEDAAGAFVDVLITSENAGSAAAYDIAPTDGIVISGVNNVSDFESYCLNRPTLDGRKIVPFWVQTSRRNRTTNSEYEKVAARLMESNDAWKVFGDLPLRERNRQDEEIYQKQFVNAFFFNKAISANQTLALWQNLDSITTVTGANVNPGTAGFLVGKRANFIGVKEQLRSCSRVIDMANQPLNFYEWLDTNELIRRARISEGRTVTNIDWYTDSSYKATLATAFMQYFKQESLEQFRVTMVLGKTDDVGMGFAWDSYRVKRPSGVTINIISHEFFDDWANAFANESIASAGQMLLCLDMGRKGDGQNRGGTIYWAQISSNRVSHTSGELQELAKYDPTYFCTMANISQSNVMTSDTGTVIVECPSNSLWIENLSTDLPVMTGAAGSATDLV